MNLAPQLSLAYEKHEAAIVSQYGAQVKYDKRGRCPRHADIQLREKQGFGRGWKVLLPHCRRCEHEWELEMRTRMASLDANSSGSGGSSNNSSSNIPNDAMQELFFLTMLKLFTASLPDPDAATSSLAASLPAANPPASSPIIMANPLASPPAPHVVVFPSDYFYTPPHPKVDALKAASTPSDIIDALNGISEMTLNSCPNAAENRVDIAASGGIGAILTAMKTHPNHASAQEQACGALWNLALIDADSKVAIAQAGGLAAILTAMKTHPNHAGVQESACGALWNLAANNADNKVAIAQAGGVAAILTAMKTHPNHAAVQANACGALRNLAVNADNQVAIAQAGGVAAILTAMKTHPNHAGVQEYARRALDFIQGI